MAPLAPPIDGELWFNSDPLTPEHLKGRVTILVFWSAGCEASLRRVGQVESLLAGDFPGAGGSGDVIAVAVHTPRMTCDDDVDRLRHTLAQHRITIPVVHDPLYRTWARYEPPGWPSTAVIDRRGRVTGISAGCRDFDVIEVAVADAVNRKPGRRSNDHELVALPSRNSQPVTTPEPTRLQYPEGLAAVARRASTRIAIAERIGDRLIVGRIDPELRTLRVDMVLTGVDRPSSVAFTDPVTLAVAEQGSNVVSSIDISTGDRSIIADDLGHPADLTVDLDGSVVIADPGDDQLYRATANSDRSGYLVLPIAGSGRTGTAGGRAGEADLAQPVAAVRTGAGLVFADAASSNLRLLTDSGDVVNITDSDLFDWGLIDGPAHRARLQRPSGLAALPDGSIIVADTGNDRLRRLHHRRIETIGLRGLRAPTDVVAVDDGRVLVADCNNHRLVAVDTIRQDAWPVAIDGLNDARSTAVGPMTAESSASAGDADQVSSGSAMSAT